MHMDRLAAIALLVFCQNSCVSFPDKLQLEHQEWARKSFLREDDQQKGRKYESEIVDVLKDPWWVMFQQPDLDALLQKAFANNLTLQQTELRITQVAELANAQKAGFWPAIQLSADISRSRIPLSSSPGLAAGQPEADMGNIPADASALSGSAPSALYLNHLSLGLSARYLVDIFGKTRAEAKAADYRLLAASEDWDAAVLVITAVVARLYFQILATQELQKLNEDAIVSLNAQAEVALKRFKMGQISAQETVLAHDQSSEAQASAPALSRRLGILEHALSVVLGEYPRDRDPFQTNKLPSILKPLPAGLPSNLLQRRPDIRKAMAQVMATHADAAAAVAAQFPQFSLTASGGYRSQELDQLRDPQSIFWNIAANITAPLFQGGRLQAQARASKAQLLVAISQYRSTVLSAFQEVEDSLLIDQSLRMEMEKLEEHIKYSQASLEAALLQFTAGLARFDLVLLTQQRHLQAQRKLIQARLEWFENRIDFITALGGNWGQDRSRLLLQRNTELKVAPPGDAP